MNGWSLVALPKLFATVLVAFCGLASLAAAIIWTGCARPQNDPPPARVGSEAGPSRIARIDRFDENILFLQEPNVPKSEVYACLGFPDWESKDLHVLAYRARNHQALFVSYGTNDFVTRYSVIKLKPTDSLPGIASTWAKAASP
jgi:hypothetical protein